MAILVVACVFLAIPLGAILAVIEPIKKTRRARRLRWGYFRGGWKKAEREEELRRHKEEAEKEVHRNPF